MPGLRRDTPRRTRALLELGRGFGLGIADLAVPAALAVERGAACRSGSTA
ncbi:hypothetical protein [Streptomyces sp. AF1A]